MESNCWSSSLYKSMTVQSFFETSSLFREQFSKKDIINQFKKNKLFRLTSKNDENQQSDDQDDTIQDLWINHINYKEDPAEYQPKKQVKWEKQPFKQNLFDQAIIRKHKQSIKPLKHKNINAFSQTFHYQSVNAKHQKDQCYAERLCPIKFKNNLRNHQFKMMSEIYPSVTFKPIQHMRSTQYKPGHIKIRPIKRKTKDSNKLLPYFQVPKKKPSQLQNSDCRSKRLRTELPPFLRRLM